jgi:hypothetical protein
LPIKRVSEYFYGLFIACTSGGEYGFPMPDGQNKTDLTAVKAEADCVDYIASLTEAVFQT